MTAPTPRAGAPRAGAPRVGVGVHPARVIGRAVLAATALLAGLATAPAPAAADPAGPTDYRSEVVAVTPATDTIRVDIVGGDSFVRVRVDEGTSVVVLGYEGEPYLRVLPDGTVEENFRSPSRALNTDRYAEEAAAGATTAGASDATGEPDWVRVAGGGSWSWHDHRAHWMSRSRPLGRAPGDQILEAVIPLDVDGRPVAVTVASYWRPAPSRLPWLLAAVVAVGAAALLRRRSPRRWPAILAIAAAGGAAAVGIWQRLSLPAETGPRLVDWLLPASALVLAAAGLWPVSTPLGSLRTTLATTAAAAQLLLWALLRRGVLWHAVLPTDAPFWLDRAATAAAGTAAVVVLVSGAARTGGLFRPARPAPAHAGARDRG